MKKNRDAGRIQPAGSALPQMLAIAFGLFLFTVVTFWSAGNNGFLNYDDPEYVTNNPHIPQGFSWENVKWALTSTSDATNWHPLTWFSHLLDYQLYGLAPRGHHLTSIFFHAANVALLFLWLYRLTGARWRCLVVALLFGAHPLRVESVAWVSERKDVLSACFFLLTLHAYYSWRRKFAETGRLASGGEKAESFSLKRIFARPGYYILALIFCGLGLMSKPMLVTVPFVLLLVDFWPLKRFKRENAISLLIEKAPFFLLTIPVAAITAVAQKSGGAMAHSVPLSLRLQTATISYARYLGKMFWPAGLTVEYPYPRHWPLGMLLGAMGLIAVVSGVAVWWRRKQPYVLMGWLWYLGMMVPVIGLVQVGVQSMADRYTYLPGIGILIILVWGMAELGGVMKAGNTAMAVAAGAAVTACFLVTQHQITFWKDSGVFFQHALEVTGTNKMAMSGLADYYRQTGRYDDAMERYRELIQLDPRMEQPQLNLGVVLYKTGRKDEGIQQLEAALQALPDSALIHGNLGIFLTNQGRIDEAQSELETALRLKPDYLEGHIVLGDIYLSKGRRDEAVKLFREALEIQSHYAPAVKRLESLGLS